MPGQVDAWVGGCLGGWVPGRVDAWVGGCLGGWVHKGVSEGVRECMAWFGSLGVCSLVSKSYVHEFFSTHFCPWVFLRGFKGWPKDMVVDSVSLQGSSLEMGLPAGYSLGP